MRARRNLQSGYILPNAQRDGDRRQLRWAVRSRTGEDKMTYASTAIAGPRIRIPHIAMPKLRSLRLSPRARALLMMGIMISPCFLADTIGYCVQRLFYTPDQIAERAAPDAILSQ